MLQFTDVHIGGGAFSGTKDNWAMSAVATMIRQSQPDLVVVTGDIAYPVPFQAGTFNNLNATRIFSNMMESLGVYWTFAFGNHDTELYSLYGRDQICDYYANAGFKYCLFRAGFCDEKTTSATMREASATTLSWSRILPNPSIPSIKLS